MIVGQVCVRPLQKAAFYESDNLIDFGKLKFHFKLKFPAVLIILVKNSFTQINTLFFISRFEANSAQRLNGLRTKRCARREGEAGVRPHQV